MTMSFEGKVALVTGGSRGIGKAIAMDFARRGADIAFNYFRSYREASETQEEIEGLGVRCLRIKAHLGDTDKIRKLFEEVRGAYGTLDFLVNNAASGVQRSAEELEVAHWDWTMNINARAAWLCAIAVAKLMERGGSIVRRHQAPLHAPDPALDRRPFLQRFLHLDLRHVAVALALLPILAQRHRLPVDGRDLLGELSLGGVELGGARVDELLGCFERIEQRTELGFVPRDGPIDEIGQLLPNAAPAQVVRGALLRVQLAQLGAPPEGRRSALSLGRPDLAVKAGDRVEVRSSIAPGRKAGRAACRRVAPVGCGRWQDTLHPQSPCSRPRRTW